MSKDVKINNYVAKHMEKFNRPVTHVNRKKNEKSGYSKHKGRSYDSQ